MSLTIYISKKRDIVLLRDLEKTKQKNILFNEKYNKYQIKFYFSTRKVFICIK
jgi:hypothetical protein